MKKPSIWWSWLGVVGIFLFGAPIGFAQEPSPAPAAAAETERVIVTGSNIPSAAEVGPNPVQTITRDLIDKSGERTTEELIRNLTVAGPNGVPSSNNGAGFTPGTSSISLRGFDAKQHPHLNRRSSRRALSPGHRQRCSDLRRS